MPPRRVVVCVGYLFGGGQRYYWRSTGTVTVMGFSAPCHHAMDRLIMSSFIKFRFRDVPRSRDRDMS